MDKLIIYRILERNKKYMRKYKFFNNFKENIIIIIPFFVIVIFIIAPIILKKEIPLNLNDAEWIGLLLSYYSGLIGGLCTLFAVSITVWDSGKTQRKNEKERDNERKEDKIEDEFKEKNRFTISIAEYLGKYITYISKYCYANLHMENIDKSYCEAKRNLKKIEDEIEEIYLECESKNFDSKNLNKLQYLQLRKNTLQREYEEKRYEERKNIDNANRIIANEFFFILNTMLHGINEASILREKLSYIQNESGNFNAKLFEEKWIDKNKDELIEIYDEFKKQYTCRKQRNIKNKKRK